MWWIFHRTKLLCNLLLLNISRKKLNASKHFDHCYCCTENILLETAKRHFIKQYFLNLFVQRTKLTITGGDNHSSPSPQLPGPLPMGAQADSSHLHKQPITPSGRWEEEWVVGCMWIWKESARIPTAIGMSPPGKVPVWCRSWWMVWLVVGRVQGGCPHLLRQTSSFIRWTKPPSLTFILGTMGTTQSVAQINCTICVAWV